MASAVQSMTNKDVVAMKKNGFSDDVIIAAIKLSKPGFSLPTADLLALKQAELSDPVIKAMLEQSSQ